MARRKNDDMTITIAIQASDNTKPVFDLTAKNADKLGKAIGNAIQIDNRKTHDSLNSINEDLKKLAVSATAVRNGFKAMADFPYKQTTSNLQAINRELKNMASQSIATKKAMSEIKFQIGDSNRNIKSVINQLENLERVAKRIGSQKITIGASTSGTSGTKTTGSTTTKTTTSNTPTISRNSYTYVPGGGTPPNNPPNKYYGGQSTFIPQSYFTNAEKQATETGKKVAQNLSTGFKASSNNFLSEIEKLGQKSNTRFSRLFSANFFADLSYNALQSTVKAIQSVTYETVLYSARTQELGIVLNSLAKVNNISTSEIIKQEQAIKSLNITTQDTRETLARFIAVGFDVKSAGPLARVAQDLAVLSGKNTSEALDGLVVAIQTLQSRNLRSAGVYITVDEVLDRLSNTTGRARDSFSTLEKQQAVLNAVMEYGGRVAGSYEAAMESTSKQIRSLDRQWREAQNAIGEAFVPALQQAVDAAETFLGWMAKYPDIFTRLVAPIATATLALVAFKTQLIQTSVAGLANAGASVKSFFSGEPTQQAQINALKAQAITLERQSLQLQVAKLDARIVELTQQKTYNVQLATELELRRKILLNQEGQLATQGKNIGGTVANAVGKIALIGTAALIAYDAYKAVVDIVNAPLELTNIDTNLAKKTQEDLAKYQKVKEEANTTLSIDNQRILALEGQSAVDEQRLSLAQKLGFEGKAYLDVLNSQKQVTGDINKAINVQIRATESKRDAQLLSARTNVASALRNLSGKAGEQQTNIERYATLQDFINQARDSGITGISEKEAKDRIDSLTSIDAFRGSGLSNDELKGLTTGLSQGVRGRVDMTNQVNFAKEEILLLSKSIQTSAKDVAEFEAQVGNSFDTMVKLSETYGTSLQGQIDLTVQQLGKEGANVDLLKEKYNELMVARTQAYGDAITTKVQSVPERIASQQKSLESIINSRLETEARFIESQRLKQQSGDRSITDSFFTQENIDKRNAQVVKGALAEFGRGQAGDQNRINYLSNISDTLFKEEQANGRKYDPVDRMLRVQQIAQEIKGQSSQNLWSALFGEPDQQDATLKFTEKVMERFLESKNKLEQSQFDLALTLSEDAETRRRFFEAEDLDRLSADVKKIQRLNYDLYGRTETNFSQIDPKTAQQMLRDLEREQKVRDAIRSETEKQRDIEDDIRVLRATETLPAIQAELLIQKQILETAKERKQTEQQLTADIAIEIDKRRRYSLTSKSEQNRLAAETFLDVQREERGGQEDLIKAQYRRAIENGDGAAFSNNPIIREAMKQAEALKEIDKKGGLQVIKIDETNQILRDTQGVTADVVGGVSTLNQNFTALQAEIKNLALQASGMVGASIGAELNLGESVAPNQRAKFALDFFTKKGWSKEQASGIVGNLQTESGNFSDAVLSGRSRGDGGKALGVAQWHPDRQANFQRVFGRSLAGAPLEMQLAFVDWELRNTEAGAGNKLRRAGSAQDAASIVDEFYERSSGAHRGKRIANAARLAGVKLGGTSGILNQIKATPLKPNASSSVSMASLGLVGFDGYTGDAKLPEMVKAEEQILELTSMKAVKEAEYLRMLKEANMQQIIAVESAKRWSAYFDELSNTDSFIADWSDQLEILRDRNANLDDPNSLEYARATFEAEEARANRFIALKKETIALDNEENYRATQTASYQYEQNLKFYNEQLSQKHSLEDANEQLYLREQAYLDENSQLRQNILEQEMQARREAKLSLTQEIDAQKRYNDEYLFSTENRYRLTRELERDRLKSVQDVNEEIIRSEERVKNIQFGLEDRLRLKRQQILEEQAGRQESFITRQLEAEMEYQRKSTEGFNRDEFRASALEKILAETKSTTELMSDLWADSFDAINTGFGGLIDKATSKLGIFGGVLGNLAKGVFKNITGTIFKNILDNVAPGNPILEGIFGGKGEDKKGTDIAGASNNASMAIYNLAQSAGMAAQALMAIAGTVGTTATGIIGAISSIRPAGGGITGASGGGGGMWGMLRGSLGSGLFSASSSVASTTTSGIQSVGSILSRINTPGYLAPTSVSAANLGIGTTLTLPNGGGTVSSGGGFGGLLKGLGLNNIGTSLLSSLPMFGSSIGGMLGGPSAAGSALGQIGGLVAGGAGLGLLGLALGPTALGGAFGSGGALSIFGSAGAIGGLGAATLGIGAAIAGAVMLGAWLIGRNKRRREEEKIRNQAQLDTLDSLTKILKDVKADRMDGEEAVTQAEEIKKHYITEMSKLKDKKTRRIALSDVGRMDSLISQIKDAAHAQKVRRETDEKIVPTYAMGGQSGGSLIRVSKGERLYSPATTSVMGGAFQSVGIPGIKSYGSGGKMGYTQIPGSFDGKDNIYALVPKDTVIANPRQYKKLDAMGYANGGVSGGTVIAPAAQAVAVSQPNITAIIVVSEQEAEALANQIPNATVVKKVRQHLKDGNSGLATDILTTLTN